MNTKLKSIRIVARVLLLSTLIASSAQAFESKEVKNNGLVQGANLAYPMRLPEASKQDKDKPFKYSKKTANKLTRFLEDKFAVSISDDLEPRMKALLESRKYEGWFQYQDSILKDLKIDANPSKVQIKRVVSPQEGLLAKLAMIDQARFTIDLSYYIFKTDETGYALVEALRRAIDRGVNIRIIVDSIGSLGFYHSEFKALKQYAYELKESNSVKGRIRNEKGQLTNQYAIVEALVFNPFTSTGQILRTVTRKFTNTYYDLIGSDQGVPEVKTWGNRRTHDKVLLIDGRFPKLATAIFGGRNISNSYYGIPQVDSDTYMDQEVIVRNIPELAMEDEAEDFGSIISNWYDKLYMFQGNKYLYIGMRSLTGYDGEFENMAEAYDYIDGITKKTQENLGMDIRYSGFGEQYLSQGWMQAKVDLVYSIHNLYRRNASSKLDIEKNIRNHTGLSEANGIIKTIRDHLWKENKRVAIISPYLWLSDEEMTGLKKWMDQNPNRKLDIYTNSIMTSDNMLAQTLVDQTLGPVLFFDSRYADQVRIFQYGKSDAIVLGGDGVYGKLHQKGVVLFGQNLSFEGTNNKDPRSQYLNSEVGVLIESAEYIEQQMNPRIEMLERDSHLWNSEEYHNIRNHELLPSFKKKVVEKQAELYEVLLNSNLWWLI